MHGNFRIAGAYDRLFLRSEQSLVLSVCTVVRAPSLLQSSEVHTYDSIVKSKYYKRRRADKIRCGREKAGERRKRATRETPAKSGRNALWLPLPHSSSSTSQQSIKDRWGPPPLLSTSGDLELLAAGERAHPLALL